MGLIGFILVVKQNVGVAIFLIVLAALGLGGVAYGPSQSGGILEPVITNGIRMWLKALAASCAK